MYRLHQITFKNENFLQTSAAVLSMNHFDILVEMIFISDGFADGQIKKLAKMVGVMHEADHTYSIRSTW